MDPDVLMTTQERVYTSPIWFIRANRVELSVRGPLGYVLTEPSEWTVVSDGSVNSAHHQLASGPAASEFLIS